MLRALARCIRRPIRDDSGVASIELAFALPVVIAAMVGCFELGGILMTEMLMEGAVRDASRAGITGWCDADISREDYIRQIVDDRTLNMVDMSKATLTTLVYDNFDDVGKPEPLTRDVNGNGRYDAADGDTYEDINGNNTWDEDMGAAGLGSDGAVVLYKLSYDYPSLTGILSPLFGPNGTIALTATTVIRNEPFGAGCQRAGASS